MIKISKHNFSIFFYLLFLLFTVFLSFVCYEFDNIMPLYSLAMIFIFFICWHQFLRFDIANSFFFFSIMYLGYALGGFYYTFSGDYYGKFIEYYGVGQIDVKNLLQISVVYSLIFYIVFSFSYFLYNKPSFLYKQNSLYLSDFDKFLLKKHFYITLPLILIVILYWIYVSIVSAGSFTNSILYFQLFSHFIKESGLSIAPYLLYYGCIYVWALAIILSGKKISSGFIFFSLLGVVLILSTARIAQAITYIFSQLIFFLLYRPSYRRSIVLVFVVVIFLGIFVHFAREASNYTFIGLSLKEIDLNIFHVLVGGGNVTDLQQLVIILDVFEKDSYLYGSSFFDWIRNSVGKYFGIDPSSIGLVIHSKIISEGSSSGAPTPGALGELHANFGIFSIVFAFFIGIIFRIIDTIFRNTHIVIAKLIYAIFLTNFVFLYPKVDSTMLINFIWGFLPVFFVLVLLRFFYISVRFPTITKGVFRND